MLRGKRGAAASHHDGEEAHPEALPLVVGAGRRAGARDRAVISTTRVERKGHARVNVSWRGVPVVHDTLGGCILSPSRVQSGQDKSLDHAL